MIPDNVTDIDKGDSENPQLVSEYVNDIYDYMFDLERQFRTKAKFLEGQEINGRMRSILYDWLVQVHLRFHLLQETLYLTVSMIDRFLQVCYIQICSRFVKLLVSIGWLNSLSS